MNKKNKIGMGLSSLIGGMNLNIRTVNEDENSKILFVPLDKIEANPNQPRKDFPQDTLEDLKNSIKSKGIIFPIIVTKNEEKYEIVAGERRYRAAKEAGLDKIPVIVKELDKEEVLEIAIIENVQRQALNAVEEADAYKMLIACGYTQQDVSVIVGKSRSYIANLVRLLSLPEKVLEYLRQDKLTIGHARALIGEENALEIANKIIKQKLNVRQVEKLIQDKQEKSKKEKNVELKELLNDLKSIEELLAKKLSAKVKITQGKKKLDTGEIRLQYKSLEELDKFLQILSKAHI
jgi:ParB family chromosome partitioning protein